MAIDKTISKIKEGSSLEDKKHTINVELLGIIKFRKNKNG